MPDCAVQPQKTALEIIAQLQALDLPSKFSITHLPAMDAVLISRGAQCVTIAHNNTSAIEPAHFLNLLGFAQQEGECLRDGDIEEIIAHLATKTVASRGYVVVKKTAKRYAVHFGTQRVRGDTPNLGAKEGRRQVMTALMKAIHQA